MARKKKVEAPKGKVPEFCPDLGLELLNEGHQGEVVFTAFTFETLGRSAPRLWVATSNVEVRGTKYAVSVDFDEEAIGQLLEAVPPELVLSLGEAMCAPFERPQMTNLPMAVSVGVRAKLGERLSNDDEEYVPFVAVEVSSLGAAASREADEAPALDGGAPLAIAEQELVILQTSPRVSELALQDMVFAAFSAASDKRRSGTEWLAFSATDVLHWSGKTTWVGFSQGTPVPLVDILQRRVEAAGFKVEREGGRALQNELTPFARLSGAGLQMLLPEALAGPAGRTVKRGETLAAVCGYRLER